MSTTETLGGEGEGTAQEALVYRLAQDYRRRAEAGEEVTLEDYRDEAGDALDDLREVLEALDVLAEDVAPATPPHELGDYVLLRELGRGSFGMVYEAEQRSLGRRVALKCLRPGLGPEPRERFLREARVLAALRHDNIVTVYDAGQLDQWCFYAMELVHGSSLQQLIREGRVAPPHQLAHELAGVADALALLHSLGMLHRDVKPGNILVEGSGRMLLSDFGLVQDPGAATLTRARELLGTPAFMSPEQLQGRHDEMDGRTDVYGLGATFYAALVGEPPPLHDRLDLVSTRVPAVSMVYDAVLRKSLARDSRLRYASAAALRDDLQALAGLGAGDPVDEPVGEFERLWRARAGGDAVTPPPRVLAPGRPPYPGLAALDEGDAPVFFGRDEDISEAMTALHDLGRRVSLAGEAARRGHLLLGASGSGKSSLLRAGLLPRLRSQQDRWIVVGPFRPLADPLQQLRDAAAEALETLAEDEAPQSAPQMVAPDDLVELVEALRVASKRRGAVVLLVIDQLEEAFAGTPAHEAFLSRIADALGRPQLPLAILATLRSDFLGTLQEHAALPNLPLRTQLVGPMKRDRRARVIEGPAEVAGLTLEEGLVEALVADASGDDALPLLAFALRELWEARRPGDLLERDVYRERLGGLAGCIGRAAEAVVAESREQGELSDPMTPLRAAFLRLVRLNEEGQLARQSARIADLPAAALPVLERFVRARLLVADAALEGRTLEVAHEALFRAWERLAQWLAESAEELKCRADLDAAARLWEASGRDAGALPQGRQLAYLETVQQADASTAEFLEAARHQDLQAKQQLESLLQLSDIQRHADLVDEAERLWPAHPDKLEAMKSWLVRGEELASRLRQHLRTRDELRERAVESPGVDGGDRWRFEDPEDQWIHDTVAALVASLETFAGDDAYAGGLADVRRRIELAHQVEERTVTGEDARARWREAAELVRANPAYAGLELRPRLGLLPLGVDPDSGLLELVHVQTGAVPERNADGTLALVENVGLVLVLLPAGRFWMGAAQPGDGQPGEGEARNVDPFALPNESPVHEVELAPFLMAKWPMTQGQWLHVTGHNPSHYRPGEELGGVGNSLLHPVEQVSWWDCDRVLRRLGLELPTEAQWEYACRAGTSTPWWTGAEKESLEGAVNLADQAAARAGATFVAIDDWPELDDGHPVHSPAGFYRASPFGLHDVHGNVFEWCRDGFGSYELPVAPGTGERQVEEPRHRVCRGGAYHNSARLSRSSLRADHEPSRSASVIGVRPAASW